MASILSSLNTLFLTLFLFPAPKREPLAKNTAARPFLFNDPSTLLTNPQSVLVEPISPYLKRLYELFIKLLGIRKLSGGAAIEPSKCINSLFSLIYFGPIKIF